MGIGAPRLAACWSGLMARWDGSRVRPVTVSLCPQQEWAFGLYSALRFAFLLSVLALKNSPASPGPCLAFQKDVAQNEAGEALVPTTQPWCFLSSGQEDRLQPCMFDGTEQSHFDLTGKYIINLNKIQGY